MRTKKLSRQQEALQAMLAGALGFSGMALEKPRSREPFGPRPNG